MMKRFAAALVMMACIPPALAGEKEATVWKSPSCGCCQGWIEHLEHGGYKVKAINVDDVDQIKASLGGPPKLASCHTAKIDGYVVEGHVPAQAIDKMLKERPKITGLASPGMPSGSPGMEGGPKDDNYVMTFGPGGSAVYGKY